MNKSRWSEIRNHHDEIDGAKDAQDLIKCIAIDAYVDDNDETPGEIIAKVILTKCGDVGVVYIDNLARTDAYAQEIIKSTLADIKEIRFITVRQKSHKCMVVEWGSGEEERVLVENDQWNDATKSLADIIKNNPHIRYRLG